MLDRAREKREAQTWSAYIAQPGKSPDQTLRDYLHRNRIADLSLTVRLLEIVPWSVRRMLARPDLRADPLDPLAGWDRLIAQMPEGSGQRAFWQAGRDAAEAKLVAGTPFRREAWGEAA